MKYQVSVEGKVVYETDEAYDATRWADYNCPEGYTVSSN